MEEFLEVVDLGWWRRRRRVSVCLDEVAIGGGVGGWRRESPLGEALGSGGGGGGGGFALEARGGLREGRGGAGGAEDCLGAVAEEAT